MSGNYFLDTNIIVYSLDQANPSKKEVATGLIRSALQGGKGGISAQVVQEFINVATKKFEVPFSVADCRKYLDSVLAGLCRVNTTIDLCRVALDVKERWGYSYYDSLIVAAALQADCDTLYSEDLHNEHNIMGLRIVNPFVGR
ncbi:PIN domain-containing protein [Chlorobaculum sp. 24CR]|uniref:PIN domain-containing protein n=1 Tax=Chlorobaculum sp. 24CR TaxID=2508878 RepID=UPI00100BC0A6|nr:PIN domain-containing protein [Chlorobaculum sp. 24CR]RXK87677.1 PIN domain-containing protein [Chlorobaculum sp. 24CR]